LEDTMKRVVFAALAVLGLVLGAASLGAPANAYVYLHPANENGGGSN
jgi:hypothetical protein